MNTDNRIDSYIAKSAAFAQPILTHLRKLVHDACPEVEETIKWGFPHFQYHGEILCSMAAFKKHCVFGFWKSSLLTDPKGLIQQIGKTAMGSLGALSSLDDLPNDRILKSYIKEAAKLNGKGITAVSPPKTKRQPFETPEDLAKALHANKKAGSSFDKLSPSHKREYIEWILEAKTDATRIKRINTTVEWAADGKSLNWKYIKKGEEIREKGGK